MHHPTTDPASGDGVAPTRTPCNGQQEHGGGELVCATRQLLARSSGLAAPVGGSAATLAVPGAADPGPVLGAWPG